MNWDAIGAVSEAVGALAVVVTLAYLATQVRYAKITASDSNRLMRASGVRDVYLAQLNDPTIAESQATVDSDLAAHHRAFADAFGVPVENAIRADSMANFYFWLHWGQFASSKSATDLEELRNVVSKFYASPFVKFSWDHSPHARPLLEPAFIEFVEETVAESGAATGESPGAEPQ